MVAKHYTGRRRPALPLGAWVVLCCLLANLAPTAAQPLPAGTTAAGQAGTTRQRQLRQGREADLPPGCSGYSFSPYQLQLRKIRFCEARCGEHAKQTMLQRCSAVCGTEGRDLHAGDINAAAAERVSAAKPDIRQPLLAAESAVAAALPTTRLRGLQEAPSIQQERSRGGLPAAAHLPVEAPLRVHLGGPEGQGLQGTWQQPHRRRALLQQQHQQALPSQASRNMQQQASQGLDTGASGAASQPVVTAKSSQQQPLQSMGTGASSAGAGSGIESVQPGAAVKSSQQQLQQQLSAGVAASSGTSLKQASAEQAEKQAAVAEQSISPSPLYFVVFFATGTRGAEKYPGHQFVRPNLKFAIPLRKTHPNSRIVMLTDLETKLQLDDDIELFRFYLDRDRFGRNAWANYYQYMGQSIFLQHLQKMGSSAHVIFMDMDVLILDDIMEVFCHQFGYGLTVTADKEEPIDIGMQFVKSGHYQEAITFLDELVETYQMRHPILFTAGQMSMMASAGLVSEKVIAQAAANATDNNVHCMPGRLDSRVCFFPCARYNYWEECYTSFNTPLLFNDPSSFQLHNVKVMQFVAFRKPGMDVVVDAFEQGGLPAAYRAFSALPHTEAGYNQTFSKFNNDVRPLCFKDDFQCKGDVSDKESQVWKRIKGTTW